MKHHPLLIFYLIILYTITAHAQNEPRFSHFMHNQQMYNPAYVGSNNSWGVTLLSRQQWIDFENNPETHAIGIDIPFNKQKSGVGISLLSNKAGMLNRRSVFMDYAYALRLTHHSWLRMGLKGGITNYQHAPMFDLIDSGDPVFMSNNENLWLPNFGLGLYYHSPKTFMGLSVPKLLLNETGDHKNTPGLSLLILSGGTEINIANGLDIFPSMLATYNTDHVFIAGANLSVRVANRVSAGVSYYTTDKLGLGFNTMIWIDKNFKIGYAYEASNFDNITTLNTGTHEILVAIVFDYMTTHFVSPNMF